jgi:hypothetical protein
MRGPPPVVLALLLLPLPLPLVSAADDGELEKYQLTDGRSFLGIYSASDGVMTIATPNGTMSFALTASDIASHRRADATERAVLAAAPQASDPPAAGAAPSASRTGGDPAKAAARLAKFTAITGLKDYPTLTASARMSALAKLPDRMQGSWRLVDLVGDAPDQERARLVHLEIDGTTANFSTDIDLYHGSAAARTLPSAAPPAAAAKAAAPAAGATGAAGAGAPGARSPAARPLPNRIIVTAFSCGGGEAASYLVTNDPSSAVGALITCGANNTLVVTSLSRTPFVLNTQDCTVYKVVP